MKLRRHLACGVALADELGDGAFTPGQSVGLHDDFGYLDRGGWFDDDGDLAGCISLAGRVIEPGGMKHGPASGQGRPQPWYGRACWVGICAVLQEPDSGTNLGWHRAG